MGRDKIKIYVVDHNLGVLNGDEYGKNLENLVKALKVKGYSVEVEDTPESLSSEFDIIILHPPLHWMRDCYEFHKEYPQIPMIFCSRIQEEKYFKGDRYDRYNKREIKNYINDRDEDGCYVPQLIYLKPFLEFIKRLTGKNKKYSK